MKPVISAEDSRLLFALLDAAADDGLLRGTSAEAQWVATRGQLSFARTQDIAAMYALLDELDRSGVLDESWIQERWRRVKTRFESTKTPF